MKLFVTVAAIALTFALLSSPLSAQTATDDSAAQTDEQARTDSENANGGNSGNAHANNPSPNDDDVVAGQGKQPKSKKDKKDKD